MAFRAECRCYRLHVTFHLPWPCPREHPRSDLCPDIPVEVGEAKFVMTLLHRNSLSRPTSPGRVGKRVGGLLVHYLRGSRNDYPHSLAPSFVLAMSLQREERIAPRLPVLRVPSRLPTARQLWQLRQVSMASRSGREQRGIEGGLTIPR